MIAPRKIIVGLVAVLAFGAARLPLEQACSAQRRTAGLRDDAGLELSLREQVSQASLVAVLGGLRALVAAITDLWATSAYAETNWAEVERDYRFCQMLQPRVFYYWDRGQWMMAFNAAKHSIESDPGRQLIAQALYDGYVDKGLEMVHSAQRHLPDDYRVWEAEVMVCAKRVRPTPRRRMAECWDRLVQCPDVPSRMPRFRAYALAWVPDREAEARAELDRLFAAGQKFPTLLTLRQIFQLADRVAATSDGDPRLAALHKDAMAIYKLNIMYRLPALVRTIQTLEQRLGIPEAERIGESRGLPTEEEPV